MYQHATATTLTAVGPGSRSRAIASELKKVIRLAGRDPEALAGALPALSAMHRVALLGDVDESDRVHFILQRLIAEYVARLPGGRDCQAIGELMAWEDADGEVQSLTTRYHKAAAHLVNSCGDFGRRQEPRLLLECARRFVAFDHEDRLGAPPQAPILALPVAETTGGVAGVHRNLDYHQLADEMAGADEIVILNTWIPGLDILADALADALAGGTYVSILMLHPDSQIAHLRSQALQGSSRGRFRQDRVRPGVHHCLDVLASISHMLDDASRRNLRVRLYDSLPSISVYGIDDTALVSFYLHGQLAVSSAHLEVRGKDSVMGELVFRELEALWSLGHEFQDIARWASEIGQMGSPLGLAG